MTAIYSDRGLIDAFLANTACVHVWQADLSGFAPHVDTLWTLLSADERERALRFRSAQDRNRCIATRGLLRRLLATYSGSAASSLRFAYSECGKPALAAPFDLSEVQFSVSRSQDVAVFAFARARRVGIDIERVRAIPEADQIVEALFSTEEKRGYQGLKHDERQRGFLNAWTRKEAFVKAIGQGLSYPLPSFTVSLEPGKPTRFLECNNNNRKRAAEWTVADLCANRKYVAALASEGGVARVSWHSISPSSL